MGFFVGLGERVLEHRIGRGGGVDVDHHRADDLLPLFAGVDEAHAAAVMGSSPVIQEGWVAAGAVVEMAGQFVFGGSTAEVFGAGVDEKETDMAGCARPAEGGNFELISGVIVFVLGLAGINSGGQAASFFHVERGAVVPVVAGGHLVVSVGIDGKPIEDQATEFDAKAALANTAGGVGGGWVKMA